MTTSQARPCDVKMVLEANQASSESLAGSPEVLLVAARRVREQWIHRTDETVRAAANSSRESVLHLLEDDD